MFHLTIKQWLIFFDVWKQILSIYITAYFFIFYKLQSFFTLRFCQIYPSPILLNFSPDYQILNSLPAIQSMPLIVLSCPSVEFFANISQQNNILPLLPVVKMTMMISKADLQHAYMKSQLRRTLVIITYKPLCKP